VWVSGDNGKPNELYLGLGEDDASHAAVVSGPLHEGDRVIVGEVEETAPKRLFGMRIGL
jgi:hypothetical protein